MSNDNTKEPEVEETTYVPPPVAGYRVLTQTEVDMMNEGKALAAQVGAWIEKLRATEGLDQRWVSIGSTDLQKGFMGVIRGIAQPTNY